MTKLTRTGIAVAVIATACMGWAAEEEKASWTDSITIKGDVRLRQEWIDQDEKDTRSRARLRARVSVKAEVNEEIDAHIRLASGSDDPVSSNQTLDDGFGSKDFRLDRAYLQWEPDNLDGVKLLGGKFGTPFIKVRDLLWDGDLNPEGVAVNATLTGESVELLLNAAAFQAEERSSTDETYMYGGQAAAKLSQETFTLLGGVSFFYWDNMEGFPTLFDDTDSFGNSSSAVTEVDPATGVATPTGELLYAEDYTEVELFVKLNMDVCGIPTAVYGQHVVNTEASSDDTGFLAGATLGKTKDPGSMKLDYNYRDLEADAVVAAFTDSDSGGGGTGVEGHRLQLVRQIAKNVQVSGTLFFNELDDGTDYTRGQFDLLAKF